MGVAGAGLFLGLQQGLLALLFWAVFFFAISLLLLVLTVFYKLLFLWFGHYFTVVMPLYHEVEETFTGHLVVAKKVMALPFFNFYLVLNGNSPNATFTKKILLPSLNPLDFNLAVNKRAVYTFNYTLEVTDLLGFFSQTFSITGSQTFSAIPYSYLNKVEITLPQQNRQGLHRTNQWPNGEYNESRKYYAGDDVRLINWKQASRFANLFVKQQDKGGFLVGQVLFILCIPPSEAQLDKLIDYSIEVAGNLTGEGYDCTLVIGDATINHFDGVNEQQRLQLAGYYSGQPVVSSYHQLKVDHSTLILAGDNNDSTFIILKEMYKGIRPIIISSKLTNGEADVNIFYY